MSYRLSEQAIVDVDVMYLHGVQAFCIRQANRYQDELFETFERLSHFPAIGVTHRDNLRRFSFWPYVIVYTHNDTDGLVIQSVLHGRQDWKDIEG